MTGCPKGAGYAGSRMTKENIPVIEVLMTAMVMMALAVKGREVLVLKMFTPEFYTRCVPREM